MSSRGLLGFCMVHVGILELNVFCRALMCQTFFFRLIPKIPLKCVMFELLRTI